MYLGKVVVMGRKWLYSGRFVAFGKTGSIREKGLLSSKVVEFGEKWFYSGNSGCIRVKEVVFGQKLL